MALQGDALVAGPDAAHRSDLVKRMTAVEHELAHRIDHATGRLGPAHALRRDVAVARRGREEIGIVDVPEIEPAAGAWQPQGQREGERFTRRGRRTPPRLEELILEIEMHGGIGAALPAEEVEAGNACAQPDMEAGKRVALGQRAGLRESRLKRPPHGLVERRETRAQQRIGVTRTAEILAPLARIATIEIARLPEGEEAAGLPLARGPEGTQRVNIGANLGALR